MKMKQFSCLNCNRKRSKSACKSSRNYSVLLQLKLDNSFALLDISASDMMTARQTGSKLNEEISVVLQLLICYKYYNCTPTNQNERLTDIDEDTNISEVFSIHWIIVGYNFL